MNCKNTIDKPTYRNPEDLSNSDEEIHPNIDTKSYRKFIKAQRETRLNELRSKETLSESEKKELEALEYKFLPVDKDVSEDSFRTSKEEEVDYSDQLIHLLSNDSVESFIELMDRSNINLDAFEDLIYLNLIEYIKDGNDEVGLLLCKIGLFARWAREFGRAYMFKLIGNEVQIEEMTKSHYEESKDAILKINSH